MFGIGPMLPVTPAADGIMCSSKRSHKRENNHVIETGNLFTDTGSHELAIMRRPSTIKTESTLIGIESSTGQSSDTVRDVTIVAHHERDLSHIVDFDFERAAKQLKDGDISDLELALFAFWIKAKTENYAVAKVLVRELRLDQGYNIDKIQNQHVRRLLQDVHDIRPRDPRHASTWNSPFRNQTHCSGARLSSAVRAVSSPLTARIDTLPPSLRLKRELAVQEAARPPISMEQGTDDYPPNTPDRPAPLSVKSRSSQISNSTPLPKTVCRSVSTPIRSRTKEELAPHGYGRLQDGTGAVEAVLLHSLSAATATHDPTDDVFDDLRARTHSNTNSFTTILTRSGDKRHGTPGRYIQNEPRDPSRSGQYRLDASDIASESSYSVSSSILVPEPSFTNTGTSYDGGLLGDDFDALESYIGSEDEDELSLLESVSTVSEKGQKIQYQFAVQPPASLSILAGPVLTPLEHRATAESHRKPQSNSISVAAIKLHRHLPLRSYESEAIMFPTAEVQAFLSRNRSKSVSSIVNSTRCATTPTRNQPLPALNQVYGSSNRSKKDLTESNISHIGISEQVDEHVSSASQHCSRESALANFPIPPMGNPVGELPILVSRAASWSPASEHASVQHAVATSALEDTYRAITKVNMTAVLQRTRARGEQLRAIDWEGLDSFERAWRDLNDVLLVTIYGRKDVYLDESDVAYIDCVARELRNGRNDVDPVAWIRRIFEERA